MVREKDPKNCPIAVVYVDIERMFAPKKHNKIGALGQREGVGGPYFGEMLTPVENVMPPFLIQKQQKGPFFVPKPSVIGKELGAHLLGKCWVNTSFKSSKYGALTPDAPCQSETDI